MSSFNNFSPRQIAAYCYPYRNFIRTYTSQLSVAFSDLTLKPDRFLPITAQYRTYSINQHINSRGKKLFARIVV